MEKLFDYDYKLSKVKTKTNDTLLKIEIDENHFFLEQNINKDSSFAELYKKLKEKNENFLCFGR